MAFDPDEYLNETGASFTATAKFDPDAYLKEEDEQKFDPDAYLAKESPLAGLEIPPAPEAPKFEARKPEEGILRKAADVPVRFLAGTTGVLKSFADVFGADSPASQQFEERQRFWNNLVSESGKEKDKRAAEIQKAAEDKGAWEQAKAAGRAFLESPTSMLATGAGSLAPFIATAGVGTVARGGAAVTKGAQLVAGTLAGAGEVKGRIYEEVKQAAIDAGKTPEEAEAMASEAQSYGENPEQIIAGGALGALASVTGIEATAGRAIAGAARKAATGAQIVGKNIAQEVATEVPQQAQSAIAKNIALQKAGFDVPTFQGVVGEATTAGIVAAALGGVAGGIDAVAASSENAQKVKMAINTQSAAQQVTDVAPLTATAVMDQAEETGRQAAADLQAEADQRITEFTETPEQRVARLQREAQEAAGIELEEEAPVSGLPPVSELPPVKEGFVRLYHGGASATAGEFTPYLDTALGYAQQSKGSVFYVDVPENSEFLRREQYDEQGNITDRGILISRQSQVPNEIAQTAQRAASGFEAEPVTPPVTPTPEAAVAPVEPVVAAEVAVEPAVAEVAPTRNLADLEVRPPTDNVQQVAAANDLTVGRADVNIPAKELESTVNLSDPKERERVDNLKEQISSEGGFISRVIVDGQNNVVEGQHRVQAMKELGYDQIPAVQLKSAEDFIPDSNALDKVMQDAGLTASDNRTQMRQLIAEIISDEKGDVTQLREYEAPAGFETAWNAATEEVIRQNAAPEAAPAAVEPTPVAPPPVAPQLEPLRRVARAEQTEEDVAGLVDAGFVEVYNGQPVITQAGLEALPEAERPRLTPEARKIQIDTRTSEAAAEAISKNLRIGVDQVPVDVRMPEGWTLVGDVYVPPQPQVVTKPEAAPEVVKTANPLKRVEKDFGGNVSGHVKDGSLAEDILGDSQSLQRRYPERFATISVAKSTLGELSKNATGVRQLMFEHLGDLYHRAATTTDYQNMATKAEMFLRRFGRGLEREMDSQVAENTTYFRATEKYGYNYTREQFSEVRNDPETRDAIDRERKNIKFISGAFASIYERMQAFTPLQAMGRNMAIAFGLGRYDIAEQLGNEIKRLTESPNQEAVKRGFNASGVNNLPNSDNETGKHFEEISKIAEEVKQNPSKAGAYFQEVSDRISNQDLLAPIDLLKQAAPAAAEPTTVTPPVTPEVAARPKVTPEERIAKLDRLKEVKAEIEKIQFKPVEGAEVGLSGLTTEEAKRYSALMMEAEGIRFDLRKELKVEKIEPEKERKSAIPPDIIKTASDELASDRGVWSAITEAAVGTFHNMDTAVDIVMDGKNPDVSPSQLYNAFNNTREALRQKFGDTIKLYRAVGKQKPKATTNWLSTKEAAMDYGKNVVEKEIPIDDIVALNVGLFGRYEEFIVGKKPAAEVAPTPEVREARREPAITPQQDRDYLDAVERGDSGNDNLSVLLRASKAEDRSSVYQQWAERNPNAAATLQKAVDDAADLAGYNIGPMWHGTNSGEFTTFTRDGFPLFFFSPDKEYAQKYGSRVIKAYLKINKLGRTTQELTALESTTGGRVELWSKFRGPNAIDGLISSPAVGNREVVVSSPEQIKSGDPVTYDDQGNIIPLSQRFQPEQADIRYNPLGYDITTVVEDIKAGRTDGPLKAVNNVVKEASALRDRVKAESLRRQQPRARGKAAILERIARERSSGKLTEETAQALTDFVNSIRNEAILDTAISIRGAGGASNFDFGQSLVSFFLTQDQPKIGARVGVHEFWHGLARFLPQKEVDQMTKDYTKALGAYLKKNPWFLAFVGRYSLTPEQFEAYKIFNPKEAETKLVPVLDREGNPVKYQIKYDADNYRYIMLDEWIAEKMTDLVRGKQAIPDTFMGKLAKIIRDFMAMIRSKLGRDAYQSFYNLVTDPNQKIDLQRMAGVARPFQIYQPQDYDYSKDISDQIRYARTERDPEVQKAAQDLKAGIIDRDEYQRIVDMRMPLRKFEAVPIPATNDDMLRGLGERIIKRKDAAGNEVTIKKQDLIQAPESIAEGTVLESRLDIPAYENADVWVVSLHEPRPNINKGNAGPVVAYTPTSVLRNVEFGVTEQAAVNIAAGKQKTTIATMKGEFVPMTAEQAYELANTNKEQWVEIGMNPVRHSYFYDKDTQTPVVSAEEVVQVGGMVLAKNPVFGKREDYLYARRVQMGRAGMETSAVEARLKELGFPTGGIIRVVNQPDADFEGRTIILDGKVTGIELNAAALKDNGAIDRVLNHEFAESANADGALNKLVERLTPKEKKEINDTITRLRYEERARTTEEAARAIEALAEAWKGRGFFTRAVARIEAWASKLGFKLTRRAAEYIAARNLADINSGFRTAYNQFINVKGDERLSRAYKMGVPTQEELDARKARLPKYTSTQQQETIDDSVETVIEVFDENGEIAGRATVAMWTGSDWRYASPNIVADGNSLTIRDTFVWPKFRGRGYGEALYREVAKLAQQNDLSRIYGGIVSVDAQRVREKLFETTLREVTAIDAEGNQQVAMESNINPDIRYSRREVRESRREPEAIPTFTEGTPEAATLKEMEASMAKVDSASEAKGGKPETYKISEIASVWMDSGLGERELQDAITEYTNLTPSNAARVAKAIARQYDIQQSIATAFLETQTGLSVEALPEGVTLPKEVDPDRPKPVMQRLFDVFMGVRVPPVKIQVNEKTALKQQIRLKAAANRAAKAEQKRTAEEVVEIIKAMELLGPVRPKQVQALAKRAARVIWTSEKSVEAFSEYAAKVVENANYDADLREAKDAQKRAKQLSTQKKVAMSPQRQILEDVGRIPVNKLDDPRMFAEAVNYYLRGFKDVLSPDYVVIPDAEMESYLSGAQSETQRNQRDLDREANKRLAEKYGIDPEQVNEMMESIDILKQIEAQENREALENLLTEKAVETQQGLRGYDTDNLQADQRPIVAAMLKVDPKALDPEERQRFIRITNNIIYNNQTNGSEYFLAVAKGQQSAREAAQDSTMIAKNRAWINLLPRFISERMQRGWALELQSVADTFRNAFGKGAMAKMYDAIGMLDLNLGFTKANNVIDEIQEKIAEFHRNLEKKYKATARNQDGLLAEGVVGFLIQSVPKKDELSSINQRRDLIKQDIANRKAATMEPDRVAMANRIEAILNRIDGESVEAILNNMKREFPANHESLVWYKDTLLPQYKDFLKSFDENFNDQANNYENPNYLTIGFTSAGPSLAITPEEQSLFYDQVSLRPKQSAYTIKRVDYTTLPTDRTTGKPKEIEFNLRRNVFNSLSDQINKAYTSSGWQRIASFMKTPEAEIVFGGAANKDFFIERLNRLRLSRMRRGSMGSGGAIEKAVDSLSVISRKLGTGIALGGIYQWIKQPPDQLITALGSGGRYDLLAKNIAPSTQKAARELLNKFSIGRRGDASSGYKYINQMEGHQNRLERYFSESKWDQAKEQAGKVADVWMVALKSSDFLAASAAWMTYYEGELNKQDIKIDDWSKEAALIESDPKRRQAAAFAEQMTDIYQGSSDPTSMATFAQSGKTGWENLVKAIFVPFNSFAIQQRMRLYSDARDVLNGSAGGKGGLAGTIGGLILFHATKRYAIPAISGAGIAVLYGLMGVDMEEPDEEKQKEEANKNWRQFLADITGNLLVGGTPQIIESQFIDAMNRASYLVSLQLENDSILNDDGEIMSYDQYSKERSPFYRYKSYDNAMSLGMLEIGLGQAEQVALQTKMLATPEEMEMYTPEEQRLLYFSTLSEWLYLMRLNDADFARLVSRARRDMIKAAEEREKEIKRIREGR